MEFHRKVGKKLRQRESYEEIWVSVGKEKEGYFTLKEGGELVGYFEKLNHSEKFDFWSKYSSILE